MDKIDFKKQDFYKAKHNQFRIIQMPKLQYLMIDGHGDPNTSKEFSYAIETLYPIAYKLKFMSKIDLKKDYVVPPLEGLWWAKDMNTFTTFRDKSKWDWTLMILTPDWITLEMFNSVVEKILPTNPNVKNVRLETLEENTVVQTLHIGSYDNEASILNKLHHEFIPQNGLEMTLKHHEIYLSDFRKVKPEKLKTLLRQPVK